MNTKKVLSMLITAMIAWDLSLHIMETFNIYNNIIYHAFVNFLSVVSYNAFWTTYWGIALVICLCILEPWKRLTTITKIVKRKKVKLTSSLLLFLLLFTTLSSLLIVMPVSEADGNPPAGLSGIYVFFAGWKGELGSPYWYTDITDCDNNYIDSGDSESYPGTVVADSANSRNWFYLIGYAYDAADGVDDFWINWYNATTDQWYNETYYANAGASYRYYWNSSGNMTFSEGHKYSFDIWCNDTVNNRVSCSWQKKDPDGNVVRKYFYMNSPTSSNPAKNPYGLPLYLHNWSYQYVGNKKDAFEYDQGNNLGKNDTGRANFTEPTSDMEWRQCGSYVAWWFGEPLLFSGTRYAFDDFTPENFYYRIYASCNVSPFSIGYHQTREEVTTTFTQSASVNTTTDGITTITYDDGVAATNNTYKLYTGFIPYSGSLLTSNNIWEMQFKMLSSSGYPSVLSNESMRSFFWLLPSNTTLNTSSYVDIDYDGISTYDELFVYNTDPASADSDHDGVSDYKEIFITGSDPNNYTSTFWNWSSDPYWNYEKPRVSLPTITSTSFENVTVNTTLEFGYNCSCGYWIGQTWPMNEGNIDSNVTCTSGEYNHYDNQYFTYTFTSLGTGQYYVVPWAKNNNGFTVFNNFSGCIADHWGYRFNASSYGAGSGYRGFTFPQYPFFSRTSLQDNNTVEWFLKFTGIYPYTDYVFRENGALKSWNRTQDPIFNSLTHIDNSTDEPDYIYDFFINHDNLNMTFEYSNSSTQYYFIQWPEAIWECNTSIAANDTILNFNTQAGIYDDIGAVYMIDTNTGTTYSWIRDLNPAYWSMTNYYSKEEKPNYQYFLLSSNLTNFTIEFETGDAFGFETGTLGLNCFNESNPTQAIGFDILISNEDGTQTYEATDLNNTHWLNFSEIPFGENTIFVVSNDSYKQRIYYYDIILGNTYNLTFYLAPISVTPRLYVIQVIDEYYTPIEDVKVSIARYINTTETYESVTSRFTDANGEIAIYLIPDALYRVIISKTGYTTKTEWYTPDPDFYGIYYPKIFTLYTETIEPEIYNISDCINFEIEMYSNNTIKISYEDLLQETINATFYTYSLYNFTATLNNTDLTTSYVATYWIPNINTSRQHRVVLRLNHTTFGFANLSLICGPLYTPIINKTLVETKIKNIFGNFELGYVNTFFIFMPFVGLLVAPSVISRKKHPGFGIILGSLYLGGIGAFLLNPVAIAPALVAIGIILMAVKGGKLKL